MIMNVFENVPNCKCPYPNLSIMGCPCDVRKAYMQDEIYNHEFSALASVLEYEDYAVCINRMVVGRSAVTAGFFDKFKNLAVSRELTKIMDQIKGIAAELALELGVNTIDILVAFRDRDLFNLIKSVKFNLTALFRAVKGFTGLVTQGLLVAFKEIHDSGLGLKLKQGTIKIDEILSKYPILKKLAGPLMGGMLLYIWLNMTFIGDPDFDLDVSLVIKAFTGNFSIEQLFGSPHGFMMLGLFGSGFMGISVPWLGSNLANLVLALCYTAFKKLRLRNDLLQTIRKKFKFKETSESIKDEEKNWDALDKTGFWGEAAAGVLPYCEETGNFLFALRSEYVQEPLTWGLWGGAIDTRESPKIAAVREFREESKYIGKVTKIIPIAIYKHESGFKYYTYVLVVPQEFKPRLNWESRGYKWVAYPKWPHPLHPKLKITIESFKVDSILSELRDDPRPISTD